jgi:hypothetical protein
MGGKYQASKIQVAAKDPNVVSSHQKKKAKKAQKTLAQSEENNNIEQVRDSQNKIHRVDHYPNQKHFFNLCYFSL